MRRAVLLPLLLIACAGHNTATDWRVRYSQMVGHGKAELVRELGPPTQRESIDGHEFLTYEQSDVWPRLVGPGRHSFGVVAFNCRATFVVVEGVVSAYRLSGNGC